MHALDGRTVSVHPPGKSGQQTDAAPVGLATVEQLRERIRKLQAAPRRYLATLRTGVAPFDALFPSGGLPLGHAVELCGEAASGRTSLALRAIAAAHRERRLCAWVDVPGELYPPAARALGVELERLLIVRPDLPQQGVWAALQLGRSGAFTCVVLDLTRAAHRLSLAEGKKLADAATRAGCLLVLLTLPEAPAEGMTRVRTSPEGIHGLRVEVLRSRQGAAGRSVNVPWEQLVPGAPPSWMEPMSAPGALIASALPKISPPGPADFVRPRPTAVRNGDEEASHGRDGAPRPGRDAPLPKLDPLLGQSGSRCCGGGIIGQRPGRDRALPALPFPSRSSH